MSRRSIATVRRPAPHPYQEETTVPGRCRCGLPKANSVHELPDVPEQAEHRRRIGEE